MIDAKALAAAFGMPWQEAVDYLERKTPLPSRSWRDVWGAAHATAFTAARTAGFDVVGDLHAALLDAQKNGVPYREFARRLTPILQKKGWWGKAIDPVTGEIDAIDKRGTPAELGSPRRLETIFRTNLQTAFAAGRHQALAEATDSHPWWRYIATMDNRVRPAHAALNGKVFHHADPAWNIVDPPNGFRCRCRKSPVSRYRMEKNGWAESKWEVVEGTDANGRPRRGVRDPATGQKFWADAGFDYSPGKERLANLGAQLLRKAETASPRLAAVAIREVLGRPAMRAEFTGSFAAWADGIAQGRGELRHVGGLSLATLTALEERGLSPAGGVLSVRDADVLHTHRDGKAERLPWDWYRRLPEHLLAPRAVLLEKGKTPPALLMVFDTPAGTGKLVVRVDYDVPARGGRYKANILGTGKLVPAESLRDTTAYELLEGEW